MTIPRSTPSWPSTNGGPVPRPRRWTTRWPPGSDPGPLAGIPIGVKDLEDAVGYVTTHGSVGLRRAARRPPRTRSWWPGWWRPGAWSSGRPTPRNSAGRPIPTTRCSAPRCNPWNLDHTPGGSSGRERGGHRRGHGPAGHRLRRRRLDAHPVLVLRAVGHEAVSRSGAVGGDGAPDWQHLSTKGPMARRLADLVAALDVVVGPDPTDLRSLPRPEASWPAALDDPQPPARVAWSPTLGYAEVDDEVLSVCRRAVDVLADLGYRRGRGRHGVRRGPDRLVADAGRRYNLRTHAELTGAPRPGGRSTRCSGWSSTGRPSISAARRRPGRGRLPRARTSDWSISSTTSACWSPRPPPRLRRPGRSAAPG